MPSTKAHYFASYTLVGSKVDALPLVSNAYNMHTADIPIDHKYITTNTSIGPAEYSNFSVDSTLVFGTVDPNVIYSVQ